MNLAPKSYDRYIFKPYNKKSPSLFEKEKAKLRKILGDKDEIHHVGSTAVPGLGGKGIIDIAVAIPKSKMKTIMNKLIKSGFEYSPRPLDEERKFLKKKTKNPSVHIHLTWKNSKILKSFLAFRDYLRHNKEARETYSKLKKKAVIHAKGEGEKYREYKNNFLRETVRKAIKEKE